METGSRFDTVIIDGSQVRALRTHRKLTQRELASLVPPLSRGYISVIESKPRSRVSRAMAERLAEALGSTLADLQVDEAAGPSDMGGVTTDRSSDPAVSPEKDSGDTEASFEEQMRQVLLEAGLPYRERQTAQRLILEAGRAICLVLKEELEKKKQA